MSKEIDNATFARLNQAWLSLMTHGVAVDGWAGAKTQAAWRKVTGFEGTVAAAAPWPSPDERSMTAFYGEPGDARKLVTIQLPYAMRLAWKTSVVVTRTTCHRLVAESLQGVFETVLEHYGDVGAVREARMDLYGGCVNVRRQRGGKAWSTHAWGVAVDLDPAKNRNLSPWPTAATMPLEVIEIFEAAGWKSGARAWGRDAMHFQATA